VRRRAIERTRKQLEIAKGKVVNAIFLGGIYLVLVWTLIGEEGAKSELLLKIAASLAPFLMFPILYLWHFRQAPAQIHEEQCEKINGLTSALADKRDKERAIKRLASSARQGTVLMSKCTNPEMRTTDERLKSEVESWLATTRDTIRDELDEAQVELFDTPSNMDPINQIPDNQWLNQTWNGMRYRVVNLRALIEELKVS
jgi:hypothetical protein